MNVRRRYPMMRLVSLVIVLSMGMAGCEFMIAPFWNVYRWPEVSGEWTGKIVAVPVVVGKDYSRTVEVAGVKIIGGGPSPPPALAPLPGAVLILSRDGRHTVALSDFPQKGEVVIGGKLMHDRALQLPGGEERISESIDAAGKEIPVVSVIVVESLRRISK